MTFDGSLPAAAGGAGEAPLPDQSDTRASHPGERQALVSNVGWSALASFATAVSRFSAGIIIARGLGPSGAGRLLYLLWIAEFVATVATLALPSAATRFIADLSGQQRMDEADGVSQWLFRRFSVTIVVGSVVAVLVASQTGSELDSRAVAVCLGFYFAALGLYTYYQAHLAGRQEFQASAKLAIVSSFLLVIGVSIATPLWGVPGAILGYLIGAMPGALASLRCFRLVRGPAPPMLAALRRRLISYSLYTWAGAIAATVVWSRTEVFFIQRYAGDYWVAMFAVGISLSTLATQGPMLLTGPLTPHFSRLAGAGQFEALRTRYTTATRVLAVILFPMCLGLSSLIPVLLPSLYGEKFAAAVPAAMVLVAFAAVAFTNVASSALYALERASFVASTAVAGAILSVLAGWLVIPWMGIWGAAWSRAAIQSGLVAAGVIYLSRYYGCRFPVRDMTRMLIASAVCAACSGAIVSASGRLESVVVAVPAAAAVYLFLIRRFRVIRAEDQPLLQELMDRLPAAAKRPLATLVDFLTQGSLILAMPIPVDLQIGPAGRDAT